MLRKIAIMPLLACLLYPAAALALGLGEIRVNSALNQPLDAEIELTNVRPGELSALQVRLAPPESYSRIGLDRPFILTQLRFAVAEGAGGQPVIHVTTRDAIREPFLNFLIEANWARGRLMREYTVMLDPPVLMPATAAPVRAAETVRETPPQRAERQVARQQPAEPAERRMPTMGGRIPDDDRMRARDGEYGPVQRDETLWSIAERVKPSADITTGQMMLALFEANPDAFYGNINQMKTGYVLRIPTRDAVMQRDRDGAHREVIRQNEAWRTGQAIDFARVTDAGPAANDGRLRLTAPGTRDAGTDPAGVAGADPALERELAATRDELADERVARSALADRLAELEQETQELRRLLQIRDAELEALTGTRPEPIAPVEAIEPLDMQDPDALVDPGVATEPEAAVDAEPEAVAEADPEAAATPRPADRRTVAPTPAEDDPGLLGLLGNPLVLALLLGIPIVIALALVALRRRRATADANRALVTDDYEYEEEADDSATVLGAAATADAEPAPQADAETVVAGEVVEPEEHHEERAGAEADEESAAEDDDALTATGVMQLDEGDPASEADFHLAYGLYDQAADLMEGAYEQHPDRVDYLMKLLEIYFAWGKTDEFVRHAREGRAKLESAGEWGNVAILGRQLSADEGLFSDMGTTGQRAGVDLDLDTGEQPAASVDLDTGAFESELDLGEPDAEPEPEPVSKPAGDEPGDLEFDLGEFELPGDEQGKTQAFDAGETQAVDVDETQAIDVGSDGGVDFDTGGFDLDDDADAGEATQFKVDKPEGEFDLDIDAALEGLETESDSADIESAFADDGDAPAKAAPTGDADEMSLDFDDLLGSDADDADAGADAQPASDSRLDLARAYIDMGDADGARTLLNEVLTEGDDAQKREAEELLALIS